MAVAAFSEIRTNVRRSLADTGGDLYTDDQLDSLINDAQRDYAEQTLCLRGESVITARENIETYDFPADFLRFTRMESEAGVEILAKHWQWVLENYGENFRSTTGDPECIYSDLDNPRQFRFYPRPASDVRETAVTGTLQYMSVLNAKCGTVYGMTASTGMIILIDETYIHVFEEELSDLELVKSIAHGQTVNSVVGAILVRKPEDTTYYAEDTIVWTHDTKVYKTTVAGGTTTEFGTSASAITCLCGVIGQTTNSVSTRKYIIYTNAAGIVSTPSDAFLENTELAGITGLQATPSYAYPNAYCGIACGSDGAYQVACSVAGNLSVMQYWEENTQGIVSTPDGYFYTTSAGLVKDGSETELSDDAAAATPIFWDGSALYVEGGGVSYRGGLLKLDTAGTVLNHFRAKGYQVNPTYSTGTALNGFAYLADSADIWATDTDLGAVFYIDDATFLPEEGAVVDITDDDAIMVIESEYGAITQLFSDTTAFRFWYARTPTEDELEIEDRRALEYYVLKEAFLDDTDLRNATKAAVFEKKYDLRVTERKAQDHRGNLSGMMKRPKQYWF